MPTFKCFKCEENLKEKGAILWSPPHPQGNTRGLHFPYTKIEKMWLIDKTDKLHLCVRCYHFVLEFLQTSDPIIKKKRCYCAWHSSLCDTCEGFGMIYSEPLFDIDGSYKVKAESIRRTGIICRECNGSGKTPKESNCV